VGLQLECVLEQKGELALSEGDVEVSGQVLTKHLDFVKSKKRSVTYSHTRHNVQVDDVLGISAGVRNRSDLN
jgi:hypothetical protein